MNKHQRSSSGLWIGMLFIIALPLVVYSQTKSNGAAIPQETSPTVQVIEMIPTDTPSVTPFTPVVIEEPTWTPWPTGTPWPTPTLHLEPTATAHVIETPINSPEGFLLYSASNSKEERPTTWYTLSFDEKGTAIENSLRPLTEVKDTLAYAQPSPNGKYILFLEPGVADGVPFVYDTQSKLTVPLFAHENLYKEYNVDSYEQISGLPFGWHPDGNTVLFWSSRTVYPGLWLVNVQTGERSIVKLMETLPQGAAVSPDGQRIAVAVQKEDFTELEIIYANGEIDRTIPKMNVIAFFDWSADGKSVLLSGSKVGEDSSVTTGPLWIIDVTSGEAKPLHIPFVSSWPFKAKWSPDGRFVIGVGLEDGKPFRCFEKKLPPNEADTCYYEGTGIYIEDLSTGETRRLANGIFPEWSPDGSRLVFLSINTGNPEIWSVKPDGTELTEVTSDKQWKWPNLIWISTVGGLK